MIYPLVKRAFCIAASFLGIVITSPLWLVAIVGIQLSDPGPVFYMANRVGKDDKTFRMFKFRSMRQGKANESVFRGDEHRIFPFGQFIRDTKIDELPQLINCLVGDMSIIGPRPASVDQTAIVRAGKYAKVSSVTPGLSGPSALYDYIYGDTVTDEQAYEENVLPTRLDLDLWYVSHISPSVDLRMIWWTVVCILSRLFGKEPKKIYARLLEYASRTGAAGL